MFRIPRFAQGILLALSAIHAGAAMPPEARAEGADAPPDSRPNVLVLIGDDHATHGFGAYGNPKARTPHLDRFAASAARFDRAYCNSPVCTASRQSFLTGRTPHAAGVTLLGTPLADGVPTLATAFAAAGYETAAFGKMHFNGKLQHGFGEVFEVADARAEIRRRAPDPLDPAIAVQPPWRPFKDPARVWLNSANLPYPARREDMPSTLLADRAIRFIETARDRPFLLFVSLTEPHSPFDFPVEMRGMFHPDEFDPPEPGPEDAHRIPAIFRDLTREEKRGINAAYATSAAFLDENMGRVLEALDRSGKTERTIVVYLGDHGYNLGRHGRFEKHGFSEDAVRAPLVIRAPGRTRAGSVIPGLTEFIDIAPTLGELAGVPPPAGAEGRSLVPLLEGRPGAEDRPWVFSEYRENEEAMIRNGRFKLIHEAGRRERQDGYATGEPLAGPLTRLYDLEADPGETRDLADRPEHAERVKAMLGCMLERLREPALGPEDAALLKARLAESGRAATMEDEIDLLLIAPELRGNDARWRGKAGG